MLNSLLKYLKKVKLEKITPSDCGDAKSLADLILIHIVLG